MEIPVNIEHLNDLKKYASESIVFVSGFIDDYIPHAEL